MKPNILLNKRVLKLLVGIISLACLLLSAYTLSSQSSKQAYLNETSGPDGLTITTCNQQLGRTAAEDLAKIESYQFNGIQQYIDDLFPPLTIDPLEPKLPVFVTAISSNHYQEGLFMLNHMKEVVRPNYKDLRVILYDIGLTTTELNAVNKSCSCEIRRFPFEKYPDHIKNLHTCAWKPIVIQTIAKEYPLLFWMDASVRFKSGNLDNLITDTKRYGIMTDDDGLRPKGYETISERTHNATFTFLRESACVYGVHGEKHTGLVLVFANEFITKYILRPWVSCALSFGCLQPIQNSKSLWYCPVPNLIPHKYHLCHRSDQSILGILYVRLFHRDIQKHAIPRKYFMFCRIPGIRRPDCDFYDIHQ